MKIYVDMDMVLVNFVEGVNRLGFPLGHEEKPNDGLNVWMNQNLHRYPQFWEDLPPMNDYRLLWEHLAPHDPYILSAYPKWNDPYVHEGKRKWVARHLQMDLSRVHIVARKEKAKFAGIDSVLIDDREKNIREFIDAGGIGILHYDAHSTLEQLRKWGILKSEIS